MAIKYDFFEQYSGPLGPHLNCVSDFTKTRKEEDRMRGSSIHSRSFGGGAANTRKLRGDKAKAIAGLSGHCGRHPDDKQSETHLQSLVGSKA